MECSFARLSWRNAELRHQVSTSGASQAQPEQLRCHGARSWRRIALVSTNRHWALPLNTAAEARKQYKRERSVDMFCLDTMRLGDLVTNNARMMDAFHLVRCVAPTDANVLVAGENGTGKELVANALHALSLRADKPFIKVNCAAIPEDLMEAELFGHRRGAFTGAVANRVGLFEAARGGALLLDEIGEMPAHLQSKLLRVLQDRQARPLGGGPLVQLDFRLICATNCDLRAATSEGRFRQDLYFRINTITIVLPPLRERPEDILLLADHFLRRFGAQYGRERVTLDEAARDRLLAYEWRGNVRELEHALERAVIVARGDRLTLDDLPECLQPGHRPPSRRMSDTAPPLMPLAELERLAIVRALEHTRGNKRAAAALLGIYRPTLYSKLRKYGITAA